MLYILATQISNYANGLTETLYQLPFSSAFANEIMKFYFIQKNPPKNKCNNLLYNLLSNQV